MRKLDMKALLKQEPGEPAAWSLDARDDLRHIRVVFSCAAGVEATKVLALEYARMKFEIVEIA